MTSTVASTTPVFFARRLSSTPLIFIAPNTRAMPIGPIGIIAPLLGCRRVHALINVFWTLENPKFRSNAVHAYRQHMANFPEHRLLFLCNTSREVALLQAEGLPASLCNYSLFVDENGFCIQPTADKAFDAVYVAVLRPYKRHQLCVDVPTLALIYYDPQIHISFSYFTELQSLLPNATFINKEYARQGMARPLHRRAEELINQVLARRLHVNLMPHQVAAGINRARVGLCLSEEEGAMIASMEYLLCGVPVVTTVNRGGRDHFFDPSFCTTVAPDPPAVARTVADLVRLAPSPETIRATVLEKVRHERRKLHDLLLGIFETEGIMPRFAEAWREMPLGGLPPRWTVDRFIAGG